MKKEYLCTPYTTIQMIQKGTDDIGQMIISYKPEIGYARSCCV